MPELSLIIPTHKRARILEQCLQHLERQTIARELEVIVVSDGHDEATAALFTKTSWRVPVMFIEIEKSQQGTARNRGVTQANAPVVLFIGDDIFLEPKACEKHLACYGERSRTMTGSLSPLDSPSAGLGQAARDDKHAVLGHITWDPALDITPVMRWLEQSGWQFGYPNIERYAHRCIPVALQHRFTYTSHISLPKSVAEQIRFREDVFLYGWEDIEWGMRLCKAGVRVLYEPDAQALHHHMLTLEQSLARMETLGRSVVHLSRIAPDLDRMPKEWKLPAYRIAALLPTMVGRHRKAFLKGIKDTY